MTETTDRYLRPGFLTRNLVNPLLSGATRLGLSVRGSRVLAVRGRTSGEWRTVPVNPLELDGRRYLVAPRGTTEWVRNIRASGEGELRLGRKVESIAVRELADGDKPAVIREYIRRWKAEVGHFFEGIDETSTDAALLGVAAGFPVFAVVAQ
jgi:deazaflavin-dependent oxidoreductase (nitroreductase family)